MVASTADAVSGPTPIQDPFVAARVRLLRHVVLGRLVVVPLVSVFAIWIATTDPAPWRTTIVATVLPVLMGFSVFEWTRQSRRGTVVQDLDINVVVVVCAQLAIAFATGGLESPVCLAIILAGFAAAVIGSPIGARGGIMALQVTGFVAFAAVQGFDLLPGFVPAILGGTEKLGRPLGPWVVSFFHVLLAVVSVRIGRLVREAFEDGVRDRLRERDRSLALSRAHARELMELSSEVAHELKNPLASVKGLAALLSPQLEGKAGERMRVLRSEVDRMHVVLNELTTLAKPLVPLRAERVDADRLLSDVSELHAGLASDREVDVVLEPGPSVQLWGDDLKLRQILSNLIQNALDASPRGHTVTLSLTVEAEEVVIAVRDQGGGITPDDSGRLFERGYTTKPTGTGVGLTLARTLARQHGGDVRLANASGGGCRAELRLPHRSSGSLA
jgi:signal transduction histidine kinase